MGRIIIRSLLCKRFKFSFIASRRLSNSPAGTITVNGKTYETDDYTTITPKIISYMTKNLLHKEHHPLCLVKQRISNYFNNNFKGRTGNSIFSIYDSINPVVTVHENFDSLLVPSSHVSRLKSDCYYINKDILLRAHTSAHQSELLTMGLDNFLIFGDVYRRDAIDSTHFPVFHQLEGVFSLDQNQIESLGNNFSLFENGLETNEKQIEHTLEASKFMEDHLKNCLSSLVQHLYGKIVKYRWVSSEFPFTHPSWELEIELNGEWTEILGCGIVKQQILKSAGASNRIGWAFGIGLERLAMHFYSIPDIRAFWSEDDGFLAQFKNATPDTKIKYKAVSVHPPCYYDLSFWLPENKPYSPNDFYDIVRDIGGDYVEQVKLIDEFTHPSGKISHCYKIVYRHNERALTKAEVGVLHKKISDWTARKFEVTIR